MKYILLCFALAILFVIIGCHKNTAPSIPTVTGPDIGNTNVALSFTAQSNDPEGDDVSYKFDFGDGTISEWSSFYASSQNFTITHSFSSVTSFSIKAQAKDKKGKESDWSLPHSLAIYSHPPYTPTTPTGPTLSQPNTYCTFSSSATDQDGDNVAIRFDWGNGVVSEWSNYFASGTQVTIGYTYPYEGTYEIKAQAKDIYSAMSDWSSPLTLTVSAWTTLLYEDFEGSFPGSTWSLQGYPTWGTESYNRYAGNKSCWCAGTGLTPPGPYVSYMAAHIVYGPFSLSDANDAGISFYRWNVSELNCDYLKWWVSIDNGASWSGWQNSGNSPTWTNTYFDLTNVPTLGNICGQSQVYFAFTFISDYSIEYEGAYVDNVVIRKHHGEKSYHQPILPQDATPTHWSGPLSQYKAKQK